MEYKRNKEDRVLEELKRAAIVELARYFVAFYIKTILADLQYSIAIVVIFLQPSPFACFTDFNGNHFLVISKARFISIHTQFSEQLSIIINK